MVLGTFKRNEVIETFEFLKQHSKEIVCNVWDYNTEVTKKIRFLKLHYDELMHVLRIGPLEERQLFTCNVEMFTIENFKAKIISNTFISVEENLKKFK